MKPEAPFKSTPSRRKLKVVTAGEMLSMPVVSPRWIWEGWIPRSKVGMLAAVSDHGKTALMLQIAAGVASGSAVLGIPTTPHPCGVLFYSLEDEPEDFQPRLNWVLEEMEVRGVLSPKDRENVFLNLWFANPTYDDPNMRFENTACEIKGHLSAMRKQGVEPALIIVETLSAVTEGDESQANTTRALWAAARGIASNADVTVIFTHHYRKELGGGKASQSSMVERIGPDKIRGSSANEGAARFVIQMGLPTIDEAEGAGLDGQKALNKGYALLRASKLKAPKPDMIFLERIDQGNPGQHAWAVHPDGGQISANLLRSSTKRKELTKEEQVLLGLFRQGAEPIREPLKSLFSEANNPGKALTNTLFALRKKDLVESGTLRLTLLGREHGKSLAEGIQQEAQDKAEATGSLSDLPPLREADQIDISLGAPDRVAGRVAV